jgi:hypothetical protein
MRITSGGDVGIGTSSPSGKIDVRATGDGSRIANLFNTTQGFGFRIRVAGSDSFLEGVNVAENAYTSTRIIGNPLSLETASNILFGTPGGERMRITSDGNLLVGSTSGSSKLFVSDANDRNFATAQFKIGGNGYGVGLFMDGTAAYLGQDSNIREFRMWSGSNGAIGVKLTAGATSWAALSDENLKDIIEPITNASEKVSTLRTVIGKYKIDEIGTRRPFLIAQDVQAVLPEAVHIGSDECLNLSYTEIVPLLVAAIKEQQAIIASLTSRIETLENQ